MKTVIMTGAFTVLMFAANAQKLKESEVPESVKKAFNQKFANAKEVKWSKESSDEFEAEFKNSKLEQSANFNSSGKWLVTETEIMDSQLPSSIQATISQEFPGYKIAETEKAENSEGSLFYEVELEKGKIKYEVQLSGEGKVLKKEEVKK